MSVVLLFGMAGERERAHRLSSIRWDQRCDDFNIIPILSIILIIITASSVLSSDTP
jgi:hypothetical protein